MNPYNILGLKADASLIEIQVAYRKLSTKAHPDAGGDVETFGELTLARDVLVDPERRAHFDRTGQIGSAKSNQPDAKLMTFLVQMMMSIVGGDMDLDHFDPREVMINHLRDQIAQVNQVKSKVERAKSRTLKMASKMKRTSDDQKIDLSVLATQATQKMDADLASYEENLDMLTRAIDAVESHTYDVEELPQMSPMFFRF
jgi:curved DNA-binding protein CbpA